MAALIDTDATGVMTTDLTADSASSGLNVSRAVSGGTESSRCSRTTAL